MDRGDFEQALQAERQAEATRLEQARRDMARHRGVCWSGLTPDPAAPADEASLAIRARARQARQAAWRKSADGAFLTAIADCQNAARQAWQIADRARAGVARGEHAAWRAALLDELCESAARLRQGARSARNRLGS